MSTTAILNSANYEIDFVSQMRQMKSLNLNSLNEISMKLVEKSKIQFLLITQRGGVDDKVLQVTRQAKSAFPYLTVILIVDKLNSHMYDLLSKQGVDYTLFFNGNYDNLTGRLSEIFNQFERIKKSETPSLSLGDLYINNYTKSVTRGIKRIELRRKEYELLEFLMQNKGQIVDRLTILETVWGYSSDTFSNTVDVTLANLREKIDKGFEHKLIHTIHGRGYKVDLFK